MKLTFDRNYFFWFLLLLTTEIAIVVFLKTGFIRHTFGDFLVVILLYCFFKSFWNAKPSTVGVVVLLIAYVIEILQYFNFLEYLHLNHSATATIIFGNTFLFSDLMAYTLGILATLLVEHAHKSYRIHQDTFR